MLTLKQLNLVKNSFTLLETLLSITLLSIVISGFSYSTYFDEKNNNNFILLNEIENKFNTEDYLGFNKQSKQIQIIKNNNTIENIDISLYQFENSDIKIFKYEK